MGGLGLFAAPAHERLYDGNRDEDDPCRMGLSQTEPHVEEPSDGGCRVDGLDQLRQVAPVDKVAHRLVDGNQKDQKEPHTPRAADDAEREIGEDDKCRKGKLVPCATDLGVEMLAMMVELVVCLFPAGKRLAVDGNGAVGIGMYAVSIVL